jgi:hypothetical protein
MAVSQQKSSVSELHPAELASGLLRQAEVWEAWTRGLERVEQGREEALGMGA